MKPNSKSDQFSLASLFAFMTICALLFSISTLTGILPICALIGMAFALWMRQGILVILNWVLAAVAAEIKSISFETNAESGLAMFIVHSLALALILGYLFHRIDLSEQP